MSGNTNSEISVELKKYINQCFKEYHIKDCLVILPSNLSLNNQLIDTNNIDHPTKYIIKHISSTPSTEGLCINLVRDTATELPTTTSETDNNKLHELIGEYMSRLATLVEQSSAKEHKPAAIWKHRNFLSSISHQIKTPLSAIFSGTKLIKHYTNNEYIDRICEYMNQSCVELTRYMNDIIDFYYLKQGVLVLDDNRVSLSDTIDYVYENYKLQMQDAEIEFINRVDTGVPSIILCDELRLTQILMNLMDNAVKFSCHPTSDSNNSNNSNSEKSAIDDPKKKILIHAFKSIDKKGKEQLTIHIMDNGLGKIDLENQDVYFQPFNQTTRNWLSAPDGIGLGLCLSRDFARKMGGDLRFISSDKILKTTDTVNWNTCIELILPIKWHTKKTSNTVIINSDATQHYTANSTCNQIVIIDDNSTNIELLTLILHQLGHTKIQSFTNSISGEDYIIKNQSLVSHAIIDIRMPRKNGLDILTELAPKCQNIHFILLTALNHDDIRSVFNQIKTNNPRTQISLLFKPIDCAELKKLITFENQCNSDDSSKQIAQQTHRKTSSV